MLVRSRTKAKDPFSRRSYIINEWVILSSHEGLVEMASELRERGWRSAVTRFRKLFLTSGSHLILAVGSLILLEEEVRKLAGICAGIELGLPKNKVLEALVF